MKKSLLCIVSILIISTINAQDTKWASELYEVFLKEGKNYLHSSSRNFKYGGDKIYSYQAGLYSPTEYATIKLKEETGKFPKYKKINSLQEELIKFWDGNYNPWDGNYNPINSKNLDYVEENYEKILSYYSDLIELDKYNLMLYHQLINFHMNIYLAVYDESSLKQKQLVRNEKYLEPLDSLFKVLKNNFKIYNDAIYMRIIGCYYNLGKYQESYKTFLEYKEIKGDNFSMNENIEKNLNHLLLLCLLEFKQGQTDKCVNRLNEIKNVFISKNIDLSKYKHFTKLLELSMYKSSDTYPFEPTYFTSANKKFTDKKIDFENVSNLIPVNNLSSRILYGNMHNVINSDLDKCFDTYLNGYSNGGFYYILTDNMWPSFSSLTIENTPNLLDYLNQEKDIKRLLEYRYIDNIIHFENIGGITKVIFMANKENKVIGVFDIPKKSDSYYKIQVNYYSFNHKMKQNTIRDITVEISHLLFPSLSSVNPDFLKSTAFSTKYESIENITYSKADVSLITNLNLPEFINCEKIAENAKNNIQELTESQKAQLAQALKYIDNGNYLSSLGILNDLVNQSPSYYPLYIYRGMCKVTNDFDGAIKDMDLFINNSYGFETRIAMAYLFKGSSLIGLKNYDEGCKYLTLAKNSDESWIIESANKIISEYCGDTPKRIELTESQKIIYSKAIEESEKGNLNTSLDYFNQLISQSPNYFPTYILRAVIKGQLHQKSQSVSDVDMFIKNSAGYEPLLANAYRIKGAALIGLDKLDEGCKNLTLAINKGDAGAKKDFETLCNQKNKPTSPVSNSTCSFVFKKPILTITYIDNRTMCCYCNQKYAKYEERTLFKGTEELEFIGEQLCMHYQAINADDDHKTKDRDQFKAFIAKDYKKDFEGVFMTEVGIDMMIAYGEMKNLLGGKLGDTNRKFDKYTINSKFCSTECEDKCDRSQRCQCK